MTMATMCEMNDTTPFQGMTLQEFLAMRHAQSTMVIHHLVATAFVLSMFVVTKSYYNHLRRQLAKCTVFVVGAGPTGVTAALIASKSQHVKALTLYEEMDRTSVLAKDYQVAFNQRTQSFLSSLGVDFDSLEGILQNRIFHTRIGVYVHHVLDILSHSPVKVTLRFGVKFTRDHVAEIEKWTGRKVVIASDGSSGQAAKQLGVSDEFLNTSCNAYGALASMERNERQAEPRAERVIHNIHFDLNAYGIDSENQDVTNTSGFSLKLFGTTRRRHLSLALPISDAVLARRMKLILDRSMMRNIFTTCYNMCKLSDETELTEIWALRHLNFSPRLFDIKLFQRLETVAYFQEADMFVLVEGEAARCTNFNTGLGINMAVAGLHPLSSVLKSVACALTDHNILEAMAATARHSNSLCKQYIRSGLKQDILKPS